MYNRSNGTKDLLGLHVLVGSPEWVSRRTSRRKCLSTILSSPTASNTPFKLLPWTSEEAPSLLLCGRSHRETILYFPLALSSNTDTPCHSIFFFPLHFLPCRNMDKTDLLKTLRQVWFPGVHSNIGGGYDDQQLANITLAWMMSQLEPFLDMRMEYVLDQEEENARYYRKERQRIRPWSFGESTFSPLSPLSVPPPHTSP